MLVIASFPSDHKETQRLFFIALPCSWYPGILFMLLDPKIGCTHWNPHKFTWPPAFPHSCYSQGNSSLVPQCEKGYLFYPTSSEKGYLFLPYLSHQLSKRFSTGMPEDVVLSCALPALVSFDFGLGPSIFPTFSQSLCSPHYYLNFYVPVRFPLSPVTALSLAHT